MDFTQVIKQRRMVRRFSADPVAADVVERLLYNARRAPSAGFSQGQEFLVLQGEARARFWAVAGQEQLEQIHTAPLVIVPFACKDVYLDRYSRPDKGWSDRAETRWPVPFWYVDAGMAVMSILLTVVDEGLGALYFGIAAEAAAPVRAAFGVPAGYEPVGAIAIGNGAETEPVDSSARRIPRRPAHEVVHHDTW